MGLWTVLVYLGCFCSATGPHSIVCQLPIPGSLGAGGRWWMGVQKPGRSRSTTLLFIASVKRHLKGYFIPACTAGWWKALSFKAAGWPRCYFLQREEFQHSATIHAAVLRDSGCSTTMAKRDGDDMSKIISFMTSVYQQVLFPEGRANGMLTGSKSCTCKQKLLMPPSPTSPKEKIFLSFNGPDSESHVSSLDDQDLDVGSEISWV